MYNLKVMPETQATAAKKAVTNRRQEYDGRDTVMHNLRRYRLMRHKPFIPKSYQARLGGENAVKLPIIYRLVQTAVGAVAKRPPLVTAEPLGPKDRGAAEDFGRSIGLLLQSVNRMSRGRFMWNFYFNLFGDGMAVTKTLPGPWEGFPLPMDETEETKKEYNERVEFFLRDQPLPFYPRLVDPLTFYPPTSEWGDDAIIESSWRSTNEVLRSLNLKTGTNGKLTSRSPDEIPSTNAFADREPPPGIGGTVQVDEVWTRDGCAVIISGCPDVFLFENPTGEHPYEWGYADPTGVEDPTNHGMSVAFPLYYIAPWIDTTVGILMAWGLFAAPTPYTIQEAVPGVRPTQETVIDVFQPGKMYNFPIGRKPGILSPPDVGQNLLGAAEFLIGAADRGGLPALVSGGGVGTRLPHLTFQAAFEAATDRLRPAVDSAEAVLGQTLQKWVRLISRYEEPVRINGWEYDTSGNQQNKRWAQIKPTEARKGRRINVQLIVDSTQDLVAKGTHAQFMVSSQLWDMERAMRFAGVENPDETRNKIAADVAWRASLQPLAEAIIQSDPDVAAYLAAQAQETEGAPEGAEAPEALPPEAGEGEPPGPGRNREGVPAGRGGGRRGIPTQRPRGRRQGPAGQYGRT